MAREVQLARGCFAIVDDEDYEFVSQWKWHMHFASTCVYAARNLSSPKRGLRFLHNEIAVRCLEAAEGSLVDHIDGNTMNNARSNLRPVTHSQSQYNRGLQSNNTSGVKGVSWSKAVGKWHAYINVEGRRISLGYFEHLGEAKLCRETAATSLHGEYARTGK